MGSERVNTDVIQLDVVREKSKQVHVRCQLLNKQQSVPLAVFNEYIMQNDRVRESYVDRTNLDAGMCLVRYR